MDTGTHKNVQLPQFRHVASAIFARSSMASTFTSVATTDGIPATTTPGGFTGLTL